MAKLTRDRYIVYIDASFGSGTEKWYKVGKSLTSLSVELNPDVSSELNIFLETNATDNGYKPQTTVDPYYANPEDEIYEKIRDIAMDRKVGSDCETKIMEVIVDDDSETSFVAWTEDIIVKPTSFGGDTAGVGIPFDVYFNGNRQKGTVAYTGGTYKTGTPKFTASNAA